MWADASCAQLGHFDPVGRSGQRGLCGSAFPLSTAFGRKSECKFLGEDEQMTTSNSNRETGNWQHISNGITATEGPRVAQFIDYTTVEESYELLPSGD